MRQVYVKRAARQLLELYPDRFTTDFLHNRKVLDELLEVESKPLKNRIAGYLTSLMKQKAMS
ncbi:MAG: 30S ribosomal protein S17e [Candidatus Hadarchaeales archaeon]|nr:MAG: 30S ribosomal protein S17e [Hadesarchaea archaeon]